MSHHRVVESKRPNQARYRARQKARGLCIYCPEPVARDHLGRPTRRCAYHLAAQRETECKRRAKE